MHRVHTYRKVLAFTAAAILGMSSLAACGGEAEDQGLVKLRFLNLAWQKESIAANKALVQEWNKANPDIQVEYVQGDWDSVNDQLVTSFEGGDAPDVFQNDSPPLAGFAAKGYLAEIGEHIPAELKNDIPRSAWDTATFADRKGEKGVYGVPFLVEPQVIIANKKLLEKSGARVPTIQQPWTWDEFADASKKLTSGEKYGVAWPLKQPVNKVLNLSLNFGGTFFAKNGEQTTVKVGDAEKEVLKRIHDQLYADKSADPETRGMGTSDPLPGFFAGKYALLPAGAFLRQQVVEQAPEDFEWVTLPPLKGASQQQGGISQTLSVSAQSEHPEQAVRFISWFLNAGNQAKLAKGDWLVPTSRKAAADPAINTPENGWNVAAAASRNLVVAPYLNVNGFDEWETKVATPAMQEYFNDKISLDELAQRLEKEGNAVLERYR